MAGFHSNVQFRRADTVNATSKRVGRGCARPLVAAAQASRICSFQVRDSADPCVRTIRSGVAPTGVAWAGPTMIVEVSAWALCAKAASKRAAPRRA